MKTILLALTAAAAFAGAPSSALAQAPAPAALSPQADAAVRDLFEAMEVRRTMAASFAEMEKQMPQMMRAQVTAVINADPRMEAARKQEALDRIEKMLPGMTQATSRLMRDPALIDEMMAEMAPLYARNYTVAELKELAAFYRTPLGRKMMALTPRLTAESMALGQKVVAPRLNGLMQDFMHSTQGQ